MMKNRKKAISTQLRGSAKKLSSCMAPLLSADPACGQSRADGALQAPRVRRGTGQAADHGGRRLGRHLAQRAHRRRACRVDLRLGLAQLLSPAARSAPPILCRGFLLRHIQRGVDRGLRLGPGARRRLGHFRRRVVGAGLRGVRGLQIGGDMPGALLDDLADRGRPMRDSRM